MSPEEERTPNLEAGRQLLLAHRPELAERELRRFLAVYPESALAQALLAWALALQERGAEAVDAAREAVRLDPEWSYTHMVLAEVYLHVRQPADAEQSSRAALELAPYDADNHATLAAALLNQGGRDRAREALRVLNEGLAEEPGNTACARLRAQALSRLGHHRQAREAAAHALRLAPALSETHAAAGWIEMAAGERGRGGDLLREALRLDPGNDDARKGLRLATYGERSAAAMFVQAQRWRWGLGAVGAVFVAEIAAVARRPDADDLSFTLWYTGLLLGISVAAMAWARWRHPGLVEELRMEGADGKDAKNARQMLLFLIFLLLFVPCTVLTK